jgi:transposase
MATLKKIVVKESITALKALAKGSSFTIQKRLQMLLFIKKDTKGFVSKRKLSVSLGVNHTSITLWKKLYETKGIEGLMSDGRIGFKPSVVSAEIHTALEKKLTTPSNNIRGYKELLEWTNIELSQDFKYITLLKYTQRCFGCKIKVARKSHIKKEEEAVSTLKKTLVTSAKK